MELNVDYEIEHFWLGLKSSMINFYKNKNLNRPIQLWSNHLNSLQEAKLYDKIYFTLCN